MHPWIARIERLVTNKTTLNRGVRDLNLIRASRIYLLLTTEHASIQNTKITETPIYEYDGPHSAYCGSHDYSYCSSSC